MKKLKSLKNSHVKNSKLKPLRVTPWIGKLPDAPKGLSFLTHQLPSVLFSLERNKSYLALEQGLGKMIIAATLCRVFSKGVVYLCPPFLIDNALNEFSKWAPELDVGVYGETLWPPDILIVPDSLIIRKGIYDELYRWLSHWWEYEHVLIADEAHRYKEGKAKRTKTLFGDTNTLGLKTLFHRHILMSGTPMPNSPIELYAMLSAMVPELIGNMERFQFGKRYCNAYRKPGGFGWDYSGSSNEKELQRKIIFPRGPYMLRLRKSMLNLPPKIEELFIVSGHMSPRLSDLDKKIGKNYDKEKDPLRAFFNLFNKNEIHAMEYRKLIGIEKIKHALPYYESILEAGEESVIIFAHHTEVIQQLVEARKKYKPLVITGQVPVRKRNALIEKFQTSGKNLRLFIGNIKAMGVGSTLTKASRVLFHEFSSVPGENAQASDRAHRFTQTKTVLVQYVVYQDSLDKRYLEAVLRKSASINKVLEG